MIRVLMKKISRFGWIAIMAAVWFTACAAQNGDPAQPTAGNADTAPVITIINGCGRADACRAAAVKLGVAATSYKPLVGAEGRIDYGQRETEIKCAAAGEAAARSCRDKLGFGVVKMVPDADGIQVVVGWDASPAKPPRSPATGVLISKKEMAVYRFEDGVLSDVWPCAIGKPASPTPAGDYEVTVTLEDPTWYWQGKAIPPGPENGLGKWFIGINKKGYGVHGTNEPASIGTAASHGCVRMYNEDVGELVKAVKAGTPIIIAE
jgi:hypothetical protein